MKKRLSLYITCLGFLLASCQFEEAFTPRSYAFVVSGEASQIDETGVSLDFEVKDFGERQITSHGVEFIESQFATDINTAKGFYSHQISGKPEKHVSLRLSSDLQPDVEYLAYPFVKTASSTTYGKAIRFTAKGSSAPEILKVSKSTLGLNMSFTIIGKNFSSKKELNQVGVLGVEGYFRFEVNYAQQDSLVIDVYPDRKWQGNIDDKFDLRVQAYDQATILADQFTIDYPRILSISTLEVAPGGELLITTNLENDSEFIYLTVNYSDGPYLNYLHVPLEKTEKNRYRCIMPEFPAGNYRIGLYSSYVINEFSGGGFHTYYPKNLQVLVP